VFGTALKSLQNFVLESYGEEKWLMLLEKADLPSDRVYHSIRFYPDSEFEQLLNICSQDFTINKNTLLRDFGKLFGEYLINMYGKMFLESWRSLDIIEKVAPKIFVTIQFVDPYTPRSSVKSKRVTPDEVVVYYKSPRKMCVYIMGIMDAVGEHFKEKLVITETKCMHKNDSECQIHVKRIHTVA
jgi:predicted hydrocarbon binding protein